MPEQVEKLIDYVVTEPDVTSEKKTQFMYPYKASEVSPGPCSPRIRVSPPDSLTSHSATLLSRADTRLNLVSGVHPPHIKPCREARADPT